MEKNVDVVYFLGSLFDTSGLVLSKYIYKLNNS